MQSRPTSESKIGALQMRESARTIRDRNPLMFCFEEVGVRSGYRAGNALPPVGETPVIPCTCARFSVQMLSAISVQGAMRFMVCRVWLRWTPPVNSSSGSPKAWNTRPIWWWTATAQSIHSSVARCTVTMRARLCPSSHPPRDPAARPGRPGRCNSPR